MKRIILAALVGVLFSGPAWGQVDLQHQRMCQACLTSAPMEHINGIA
jgi:hypothetical protein